jgi:HlyD family secretion protein
MTNRVRTVIIILVVIALAFVGWRLLGPSPRDRMLSGYIEAESLFLAAPVAGTLSSVSAQEGGRVAAGARLFTVAPATLSAQSDQARAQVLQAQTQIAAAAANVDQANAEAAAAAADVDRARRDLDRLLAVRRNDPGAVAGKDIDAARAALRNATARLNAARELAQSRRAQVDSARAQESQARGGEREVAIRLDQLSPPAPASAPVEDVFFQPGEWVNANQPVVSLIPDNRVKVRFYVPEREVARYRPGRTVRFACDACRGRLTARIAYVSPRPEFTPPIIFSRDSRDRLVFMVEAWPTRPATLMPGLPVDVEPLPGN